MTGGSAERTPPQAGKFFKRGTDILLRRVVGVDTREITVVLRTNRSAFVFCDVLASKDPISPERGESLFDVALEMIVAPRPAGVINTDWVVGFELAGEVFRRGKGDFAEGDAD
jgi:hypothetical protein